MASVFFHTNRPTNLEDGERLGFVSIGTGWMPNDPNLPNASWSPRQMRTPFAALQAQKFKWVLSKGPSSASEEPWVLADTDTIVQCDASTFRERFLKFGSPLVVGAEVRWWPYPDKVSNPWPPSETGLRYPNSGLACGSKQGYRHLVHALYSMRHYPCCPNRANWSAEARSHPVMNSHATWEYSSSECMVEDQHCMQAALLRNVPHALDTRASIFLNVGSALAPGLLIESDGKYVSGHGTLGRELATQNRTKKRFALVIEMA
ncbi:MAG: hypothetical protein SGPRY_002870 [Prymnesium sp.]